MYILTERGSILKQYSLFDDGSVPSAYTWIRVNGYRILSVQLIHGHYYIIVGRCIK